MNNTVITASHTPKSSFSTQGEDHQYEGAKHFYTVKHDVNLNFSLFTKEYNAENPQALKLSASHKTVIRSLKAQTPIAFPHRISSGR